MKRLILVISVLLFPIFSDAEELWLRNVTHVPPGKVLSAIDGTMGAEEFRILTVKGKYHIASGSDVGLM